jgi:SAM-dependent methyltransferase
LALNVNHLTELQRESSRLAPLIDYLRSTGYTLSGIAKLVKEKDPSALIRNGALSAIMCGDKLEENTTPLATLAQLFLFGGRINRLAYEKSIPEAVRQLLERYALTREVEAGRMESEVTIVEYESAYLVSDRLFVHHGGVNIEVLHDADVVWPMSEWSLNLYRALEKDTRWRTFLDVGVGSGCVSILAHERYARVVGVDLNPRAVAFATLNANLNTAGNVINEIGNCLEPHDSSRYDHIAFAAPGGPSFDETGLPVVSYGGPLGHELLLRFLSERVEHLLSPIGCCQAWGIFVVQQEFGSLQKLLEQALSRSRLRFTVQPLREGGLYISPQQIAQSKLSWDCHYASRDSQPGFLEKLKRNRVREVVSAVVTLRVAEQ